MEIVIGILGLIIAIITFKYSFFSKPTEELNHLKVQFRATQRLSNEVQKEIKAYISNANAADKLMFPNVTFSAYLSQMEESYQENLSEILYNKSEKLELTKSNILSMTKSLETQFSSLLEIQTQMKLLNRQLS